MQQKYLSEFFEGVCTKRLSAVEADPIRSNQHEFNGTRALKSLLGEEELSHFPCVFLYLDDGADPVRAEGDLTWYDARAKHTTRSEHRLYYSSNCVSSAAQEGDSLILAKKTDGDILLVVTKAETTVDKQLAWLFRNKSARSTQFQLELIDQVDITTYAARLILDEIGINTVVGTSDLETMLRRFDNTFPDTRTFSAFAREPFAKIEAFSDPDQALVTWMDREDSLFRQLENHLVSLRISNMFDVVSDIDVDSFVGLALSVLNRRKSRVGFAFENHLEELFIQSEIRYSREATTEMGKKPDFVFPGIEEYRSTAFPDDRLSMLGAKYSCKDRWRQVLPEAARIPQKHLVTMQPAISNNQTNQMRDEGLQLVVPTQLQETFDPNQQEWLMDLEQFIELVRRRQSI